MKGYSFAVIGALSALSLLAPGCGPDDTLVPGATEIGLLALPATPATGVEMSLTVTAHNQQTLLKTVAVDFENDGTADGAKNVDGYAISATFTHTYSAAGSYNIQALVIDANGNAASKSLLLLVFDPATPPVTITLRAESAAGDQAVCQASGPPAACDGCLLEIPATGLTTSIGSLPHGTPISVTQAVEQLRYLTGTATTRYACSYSIDLYAGTPGNEASFGHGTCTTDSGDIPERLTCSITVGGVVP